MEKQVIQDISKGIIRKARSVTEFLISKDDLILQNAVSLRYILEILITIILMNKEKEYKLVGFLRFPRKKSREYYQRTKNEKIKFRKLQ